MEGMTVIAQKRSLSKKVNELLYCRLSRPRTDKKATPLFPMRQPPFRISVAAVSVIIGALVVGKEEKEWPIEDLLHM